MPKSPVRLNVRFTPLQKRLPAQKAAQDRRRNPPPRPLTRRHPDPNNEKLQAYRLYRPPTGEPTAINKTWDTS